MKSALVLLLLMGPLYAADPVPFSHKTHAPLQLDCVYCHATALSAARATYPEASTCMTCHLHIAKDKPAIQKLAALPKTDRVEPENSVYMLAEFVYFSHARHRTAQIACAKCHGQVDTMDTVAQVLPMTMKACVSCHRATHAVTACGKCHELMGQ